MGDSTPLEPDVVERVALNEAWALKVLAQRERDLGFVGYAGWLEAGCPPGVAEYPQEKLDDILFFARAAISAQSPQLEDLREALVIAERGCRYCDAQDGSDRWVHDDEDTDAAWAKVADAIRAALNSGIGGGSPADPGASA